MTWGEDAAIAGLRFVALDCETTGLDPRRDRVITIGAVAVVAGEIDLGDTFEALLQVEYNTSAVTVHGVTRDDSRGGLSEAEAVRRLRPYLGDAVIVGHHVAHDVQCLSAAAEREGDPPLANRSLDTMDLALHLERDGAFAGAEPLRSFTLDALCARFGIVPHDRHTAPGDAFLTAQVFLRLVRLAARHGRTTLDRLAEPFPVESGD